MELYFRPQLFVWRTFCGGQSKSNNSLTRLLSSQTSSEAIQCPPLLFFFFLPKSCREGKKKRETSFKKGKTSFKHLIATRIPYAHLLWNSSTMWLPFRKYGVRLWGRVRFWRGARVVTRMTPKTLYTRRNSLLMCFRVSFHEHCIVPLTSAFEDCIH